MSWPMPHYQVNPRYTPGSPAQVDIPTAERVAKQEREHYEIALSGVFGQDEEHKARTLGLKGIVENIHEERHGRQNGWRVYDLLIDENYWRDDGRPPTCERSEDHEADPSETVKFTVDKNGNVLVQTTCIHCGRKAHGAIVTHWAPAKGEY